MKEVVIGMAHRGRLSVLANIIGKSYSRIFGEFEGLSPETIQGSGDVKYHLGAKGTHTDPKGRELSVQVVANPSHLEAVDPVLEGQVRAKQELRGPNGHHEVLPILIHGDAAFAGQGVVVETLNLSQLPGYRTGGRCTSWSTTRWGSPPRWATPAPAITPPTWPRRCRPHPPRQRRRPRRRGPGGPVRLRLPPGVQPRRGDRHGLLPAQGTQRGRRAVLHPAADVPADRAAALGAQALHGAAGQHQELSVEEGEALLEEYRGLLEEAFAATKDMVPAAFEPIQEPPSEMCPPRYRWSSYRRSPSGSPPRRRASPSTPS